jgi:hypothetical protein
MKNVLLLGVIASFVGFLWEDEAQACHRRHRARCCQPCQPCECQPCQPCEAEPSDFYIYGTCFAGYINGVPCYIRCPDGCAAAIVNGKCVTSCAQAKKPTFIETKPTDRIHLNARDYPLLDLDVMFGFRSKYGAIIPPEMKDNRIRLHVRDVTVPDIIKTLGLKTK